MRCCGCLNWTVLSKAYIQSSDSAQELGSPYREAGTDDSRNEVMMILSRKGRSAPYILSRVAMKYVEV